ncbi:alpha/beta hydrolase [Virgibacillus flavescens]|uniref:alpha/beta hydrolase n=1 Tax=Virgibacillus flavescens TaxID=1611422 RepID=UPI003D33F6AB
MVNYHSVIIGKGEPLIFLPAAGFSGMEGLNIAESLAEDYECHLLDMPGMGKSEGIHGKVSKQKIAQWLKEYFDQHNFKKAVLFGHSMGGALAMCFASMYPDRVTKLVLLDQGHMKIPRFPIKDFGPFGYVMPLMSGLERLAGKSFIRKIEKFFISDTAPSETEKDNQREAFCERLGLEESDHIRKAFNDEAPFTSEGLRLMFGYYRLNLPKMLKELKVPCLLIYASFKGIDEKRAVSVAKSVNKLSGAKSIRLYKMDTHHYVHWSGDECLLEIKRSLGSSNRTVYNY